MITDNGGRIVIIDFYSTFDEEKTPKNRVLCKKT